MIRMFARFGGKTHAEQEEDGQVEERVRDCSEGSNIEYRINDGRAAVAKAASVQGDVVIPDHIDGAPVVAIGKGAFEGNADIKSVKLPSTVEILGSAAFKGCTSLENVELPVDLEVINASAFQGCGKLESVVLPSTLKRLCSYAFDGCKALCHLPHRVKGGVSSTSFVTDQMETHLPISLEYIGEAAFRGCATLSEAVIPYKVSSIKAQTFEGCTALSRVTFAQGLSRISEGAFADCPSLGRVRIPESVQEICSGAFDSGCRVIAEEDSAAAKAAENAGLETEYPMALAMLSSAMDPHAKGPFYTATQLAQAESAYETRTPIEYVERAQASPAAAAPRFAIDAEGVYASLGETEEHRAKIVMVGDLMCRFFQQGTARHDDGTYDFEESFAQVKPYIQESDFAIGNMESMVSASSPYMSELRYVEDRPHLNAPEAFPAAVRNAGFDAVVNAQNHIYDTGTRGIFETLDALNRCNLMHVGVRASADDARFLSVAVNGIRIAVVAYMDPARQKMKQVNFTEEGLDALFSFFDETRISEDIAAARAAGAEFVIAYCHWGREYTAQITARQEAFARMVADAGADYIFGCHSHCPQPRTVILARDGRRVPCVYSGGNFLSDINIELPKTRDTLIASIELARNELGQVELVDECYRPARIVAEGGVRGGVVVRLCEEMLKGSADARSEAEEAIVRIASVLGGTYAPRFDDDPGVLSGVSHAAEPAAEFAIAHPVMARIDGHGVLPSSACRTPRYVRDGGAYALSRAASINEAKIACLGELSYAALLERDAQNGDVYNFRPSFKNVRECVADADFVIGNLTASCADFYPSSGKLQRGKGVPAYRNARIEYLDAVRFGGVDCLAAACQHNLDCGVEGVFATVEAIKESGMVASGLGFDSRPVFDVNGIKIAVLSYVADWQDTRNVITHEGAEKLLSIYSPARFESDLAEVRSKGAEFALVYLNCGTGAKAWNLEKRRTVAREIAELGADYIVCVRSQVLSAYDTVVTSRGAKVPVATSLGTLISSDGEDAKHESAAILQLTIRRDCNGAIEVEDSYIPAKRFSSYDGAPHAVFAACKHFNSSYATDRFAGVAEAVAKKIGPGLLADASRKVTIGTYSRGQLTIEQICKIAGAELSSADRRSLGDLYTKKVRRIASRKQDLIEGCVAVMANSKDPFFVADAESAGAVMVIGGKKQGEIPYLEVSDPVGVYIALMSAIRDMYDPVTVAITGTMGKTTTKELMHRAFAEQYETLCIEGNYNTVHTAGVVLQKLRPSDQAYIQEVHGGTKGWCSMTSRFVKPHICVITSIDKGHIQQMGSIENIIAEKMSIVDGLDADGVLILNDDNGYLHEQNPSVRTVRYSMSDPTCDYHAKDILDEGDRIRFTICCAEGEYPALLNIQGLHNVGNALAVFAAGREAGIPPHRIIAGLARYASDAIRQNVVDAYGYKLMLDCYNSNPTALLGAVRTLCGLPSLEGGRRIAVIGDMAELGEDTERMHYEVGLELGEEDVDAYFCYGPLCRRVAEGIRELGGVAYAFEDRAIFNDALSHFIKPKDSILFKASHGVHLFEETVVPLFGNIA